MIISDSIAIQILNKFIKFAKKSINSIIWKRIL